MPRAAVVGGGVGARRTQDVLRAAAQDQRRQRGERQEQQPRVELREQDARDDQRDAEPDGGQQRLHRPPARPVELGAQHLQPVRVLGALVVLDARRVVREPDEVALQAHDRLVAQLEVEDVREVAGGQRGHDQHRDEDGGDRRPPGVPGDRRVGQDGERGCGQRQRHRLQHHEHRRERELAGADPPRQPEQRPAPGHGLPHDSTSFPSASSPAANRSACSRNSRA